ncbi:hypothetical protein TSAR_015789 [Trichomalopsis sarcophagae]|uniref:Uncharacterized protein n=1 Tax=Trichomalopsis sarcophagae TaxID=543379 RepID=A0A232FET8_9HYME|nr:hypothetical protein TSAR_015789 [Trichomalopsis sarcophagae]
MPRAMQNSSPPDKLLSCIHIKLRMHIPSSSKTLKLRRRQHCVLTYLNSLLGDVSLEDPVAEAPTREADLHRGLGLVFSPFESTLVSDCQWTQGRMSLWGSLRVRGEESVGNKGRHERVTVLDGVTCNKQTCKFVRKNCITILADFLRSTCKLTLLLQTEMQSLRRLVRFKGFRLARYPGYRFGEDVLALGRAQVLVEVTSQTDEQVGLLDVLLGIQADTGMRNWLLMELKIDLTFVKINTSIGCLIVKTGATCVLSCVFDINDNYRVEDSLKINKRDDFIPQIGIGSNIGKARHNYKYTHLHISCNLCMASTRSAEVLAAAALSSCLVTADHQGRSHGSITSAMALVSMSELLSWDVFVID